MPELGAPPIDHGGPLCGLDDVRHGRALVSALAEALPVGYRDGYLRVAEVWWPQRRGLRLVRARGRTLVRTRRMGTRARVLHDPSGRGRDTVWEGGNLLIGGRQRRLITDTEMVRIAEEIAAFSDRATARMQDEAMHDPAAAGILQRASGRLQAAARYVQMEGA